MIEKLPKKWQKFEDLLIIPANVEFELNLEQLAQRYKGNRLHLIIKHLTVLPHVTTPVSLIDSTVLYCTN